jgi:hypothetical protein
MDHNRYSHRGGAGEYWDENDWTGRHSLAEWKVALGVDAASTEGDPGLDGGMHLAPSSPCIDAGGAAPGVADDYDGDARSGAFDVGADEFNPDTALSVPPPAGTLGTGGESSPGGDGGGSSSSRGCAGAPADAAVMRVLLIAAGLFAAARRSRAAG